MTDDFQDEIKQVKKQQTYASSLKSQTFKLVVVLLQIEAVSLNHTLHHLRLDTAVSKVLPVEVLRFVAHTVATVPNDWDVHA